MAYKGSSRQRCTQSATFNVLAPVQGRWKKDRNGRRSVQRDSCSAELRSTTTGMESFRHVLFARMRLEHTSWGTLNRPVVLPQNNILTWQTCLQPFLLATWKFVVYTNTFSFTNHPTETILHGYGSRDPASVWDRVGAKTIYIGI